MFEALSHRRSAARECNDRTARFRRQPAQGRASRWGLYLPFVAFGLICLAWSGYWLVARTVVLNGIEREIMAAAQRGDRWSCEGQTVRGFPFRIEVRCADVRLARQASAGVVAFSSGPVVAIGQPTTPNHIIIHGQGPATARLADGTMVEARWELFEASRRISRGELERFSADLRRPTLTVRPPQGDAVTLSSQQTELYLRRNPERPAEQKAVDVFLKATQLASAHLDTVFGDPNPANLELQLTVDRADVLSRGLTPAALEQWRQQDGKADLTRLALVKGVKRVEGTGSFTLDAERGWRGGSSRRSPTSIRSPASACAAGRWISCRRWPIAAARARTACDRSRPSRRARGA